MSFFEFIFLILAFTENLFWINVLKAYRWMGKCFHDQYPEDEDTRKILEEIEQELQDYEICQERYKQIIRGYF